MSNELEQDIATMRSVFTEARNVIMEIQSILVRYNAIGLSDDIQDRVSYILNNYTDQEAIDNAMKLPSMKAIYDCLTKEGMRILEEYGIKSRHHYRFDFLEKLMRMKASGVDYPELSYYTSSIPKEDADRCIAEKRAEDIHSITREMCR